jgi:hypothetical protein
MVFSTSNKGGTVAIELGSGQYWPCEVYSWKQTQNFISCD